VQMQRRPLPRSTPRERSGNLCKGFVRYENKSCCIDTKAIDAINDGMFGGVFLQTTAALVVRCPAVDTGISADNCDQIRSFLCHDSEYVPQSGSIVGILKQMKDTMSEDLASTC